MSPTLPRTVWRATCVALLLWLLSAAGASANTYQALIGQSPQSCGAMSWYFAPAMLGFQTCAPPPQGHGWVLGPAALPVPGGQTAAFQLNAPAGLSILGAQLSTVQTSGLSQPGQYGWQGASYWNGATNVWYPQNANAGGVIDNFAPSSYYGWKLYCYASSCSNPGSISVLGLTVTVQENTGPSLVAVGGGNLWYRPYEGSGWVWNTPGDPFSVELEATDPSGVCDAKIQALGLPTVPEAGPVGPNEQDGLQQCPSPVDLGPAQGAEIDTTQIVPVGQSGSFPLTLSARNAAGLTSATPAESIPVDNVPVGLTMAGPTTASSTAGTQYLTASATSGPSGVTIGCSVDGGAEQWQNGAGRQVAVAGVGQHIVSCAAHNFATDPTGANAYSATQSWPLDIGAPTVSWVAFTKIVGALNCRSVRERVKIPAHLVTIRRRHRLIRRHVRARTKVERVERCHPRTAWRRESVWVTVRRHGKKVRVKRTERVKVVLTPHGVSEAKQRVAYGSGTVVHGWLGTTGNVAVAGQPVEILAAADDGGGRFAQIATATTAADGTWSAAIPPGPSRVIEAVYDGSATLLPTTSAAIQTVVPAKVRIRIVPKITPWGSQIRVIGQVLGGYVPTHSNLLRLNVGTARIGQLAGLPAIQPDGKFVIYWRFDRGHGVIHPWFSVGTLAEASFPYSPGTSKRVTVTLGEPTPPPHHRRRPPRRAR